MPNKTIFVRSPFKVSVTGTANQNTTIELRIYNNPNSIPVSPTRIFSKPIPSSLITTVWYDVSPFIREYIEHIKFTEGATVSAMTTTEYARCEIRTYLNGVLQQTIATYCLDGYGFNDDGYNYQKNAATVLIDEGEYYTNETTCGSFYIDTSDDGNSYIVNYNNILTGALIGSLNTTNGIKKFPYVLPASFSQGGNIVNILQGGEPWKQYTFLTTCSGKYTPLNCDFVNRYGVWQRIVLLGASRQFATTQGTEYKFMNRAVNFNTSIGNRKELNVNGTETLRTNTGWVSKFYREVIKQLMLSETVLINDKAVILKSKSQELVDPINTKMINYTLEFEYANDYINTGV
jgi:hypothetical protein